MCPFSSEWDDLDPNAKWRSRIADPAVAARQIAADRLLIAALKTRPIDLDKLHTALKDDACASRTIHSGFPALHIALGAADAKALALLLRFGASTDDLDSDGRTALDFAYHLRFKEGIHQLKQLDAPTRRASPAFGEVPEASDAGEASYRNRINSFLRQMIEKGSAAQVQQALDLGAEVNATGLFGRDRFPPLHQAVALVEPEKVKILLQAGADVFAKGPTGGEVADALWFAHEKNLLSPAWYEIFDELRDAGYQHLFAKHPADFTPEDLRQPLPTGEKDAPSLLHHLVQRGQVDFVLGVFEKHPEQPLTAAELKTKSKYYNNNTLLQAFSGQKVLSRIFTAAIWQGRVDEMLSLKPEVEKDFFMKDKIDFDRAAADVRAARLAQLGQKAGSRFKLQKPK